MTREHYRDKLRAVFLTALMIGSVFGAGIAFTGTAAASTTSISLSDNIVQGGDEIAVNGTVGANGTVHAFVDTNDDGKYNSSDGDIDLGSVDVSNWEKDEEFSITASAPSESGTYDIYVVQTETLSNGLEGERSAELQVDDDSPKAENPSPTDKVSTTTPTITVDLNETETSINESTIQVSASNGGQHLFELTTAANGVSYADGTLTVDVSESKLDKLPNGETISVTVVAEDMAGNSLTGDATTFSFTVNTDPVTASITQAPSGTETTDEPVNVTVNVETSVGNMSSATLTVESDDGSFSETVTNDTSGESKLTFDASFNGTFSALPDGDYTVTVEGENKAGDTANATSSFSVDTTAPTVDSVTVSDNNEDDDNNIVDANEASNVEVTIEFSEPVKSFDGAVNISDSEVATFSEGDDGDFSNNETVTFTLDLGTVDADDGSAVVNVTDAVDEHDNANNGINTSDSEDAFSIDTQVPGVTLDKGELPQDSSSNVILSGVVDIEDAFSASNTEGNEYSIYVSPGATGDFVPLSDVTSEPLNDFDTTTLPEGQHTLKLNVTDDAGNTASATQTVYVDNTEPTIKYAGPNTLTGEVDATTLVDVTDIGTESYTVDVNDADGNDLVDFSSDAKNPDTTFNVNDNAVGEYTITVTADDPVADDTANTVSSTFNPNSEKPESISLGIVKGNESNLTVTYQSDVDLDSLNVTVSTDDNYYTQSSTQYTIGDFDESNDSGTYTYTLTHVSERDGDYKVAFDGATYNGQNLTGDVTDTATVDNRSAAVIDADVSGTDKGRTHVTVTFSEPGVSPTTGDFTFADGRANILGVGDSTSGDGVYTLTFDREIQTGDDPKLDFGQSNVTVDSIELDLNKGANYVSVPVETGEVSLDSLDLSGVDVIWAYDGGEWTSYDPSAEDNSLTALKGGQGYILYADSQTTLDVRGYTLYETGSTDAPNNPASEGLEAGWNLIGHFQEGDQSTSYALTTIAQVPEVGVIGPNNANASTMQPGNAYWVFVESSDLYTPVNYGGVDEGIAPSVSSVTVEKLGGSDPVTIGDKVNVSATITDDNLYTQTVDASSLGGPSTLTLTQMGDSDTYNATFTVGANSITASDGSVSLTVEAVDEGGVSTTGSDSITLDTTVNTVKITQPDSTNADTETLDPSSDDILVTSSDTLSSINTVDVTIKNVDTGNYFDGGSMVSSKTTIDVTGGSADISGLSGGLYEVTANATDTAGNYETNTTRFRVHTTGDLTLGTSNANPNPATWSSDSDTDTTFTFTLNELSADGNTDTVTVDFPSELAGKISVSDASVTAGSGSVSGSASLTDVDGTNDGITFDLDADDASTYSPTITLQTAVDYQATGTYPVTIDVTDSDGDTFSGKSLAALDANKDATISSYQVTNPSSQDVKVSFTIDEQLSTVSASVSGAETATLSGVGSDFTETDNGDGTYTYKATYAGSSDGSYTVTLDTANDALGTNEADSNSGSVSVDTTSPSFSTAGTTSSSTIDVTFSEAVTASDSTGFTVNVGGSPKTLDSSISGSGTDTITLTLSSATISSGDTVTVSYDGSGDVTDEAGNDANTFSGETVTNNQ